MITMGSFLEDYKNAKSLGLSIDAFLETNPQHLLALGMKKIYLGLRNEVAIHEVIQYVNQINYKEYAVEEQLIFLELLFHYLIQYKSISSALPILATVKRLVSQDLEPEWQAIPYALDTVLYFKEGNFKKQLETIENERKVLKFNSGRYILSYWTNLILLAYLNQFEKLEYHLNEFKKLSYENVQTISLDYIYLIRNEEMGLFEANKAVIEKLKTKRSIRSIQKEVDNYDAYLKIFLDHELPEMDDQDQENWYKISTYYLLKNDPKNALFWAHKYSSLMTDYKSLPNLSSFYLIRAELANNNINTAKYLLINRRKIGNVSLYDDFFWFRLHHNKGETQTAQIYFNRFYPNIKKNKLEKRFEFEVKLSPEISPKDIQFYIHQYETNSTEAIASTEPHTTSELNQAMQFIVGESDEINKVKELVIKFSSVDTAILITGETGTGKELIAKALSLSGPYKKRPFLPINCGAISDHLLQSELFGHKKGAFTGAIQDHKGVFEVAENGIVFLDEIGEISQTMQVNLLRVLESNEFRPVGSSENKKLKCKIIAATNRNLAEHVKSGHFRKDLQYRLERLVIELPPLRHRPIDIPILINHFLNVEYPNLKSLEFDKTTLKHLQSLPWDGNIRELRNEMEKIRLFNSDKNILNIATLSPKYQTAPAKSSISAKIPIQSPITPNNHSPLNLNSKFRRLEELKKLFHQHHKLTRSDVEKLLQVSNNTAASYISSLEQEKFIIKKNIANSKSSYYELNK